MKYKIEYGTLKQGFKVWNVTRKVLHFEVIIAKAGILDIRTPAGDRLALLKSHPRIPSFLPNNGEKLVLILEEDLKQHIIQSKDEDNHNWVIRSEEEEYITLRYADKMTCIFHNGIVVGKIGYEKKQWLYRYIDFEMLDNYNPALLLGILLYFFIPGNDDY